MSDAAPTPPSARRARKVREGLVASSAMDKTLVVQVTERVRHPRYRKTVQRTKRFYVHDEANAAGVGDRVLVAETRPLSKLKRWRLVEVLERAR
jgi:small subunit ribosomal protein S17